MIFHEISPKDGNCTISDHFPEMGGSETLIFLRKNNDLGAGPPKDPILAKCTGKLRNLPILLILGGKLPKRAEKVIFVIFMISLTDLSRVRHNFS